ncbi:DNA-binding transcriptional regulator [Klebsiella variicola]|uniref:DNA-binding transcriptional regulator n=1 Tax=Klebsiella variicola TaxID=244366 RepID=A0A7H4MJF3_KLEVA|nr:DNA-binding transcriptional regulator [Klebsiella variicola]
MVITESMAFQIKFHHIRAFVEVAREGSIRGASRALAVSQPALTKAIKELEEGLSAQLFVRRSQGVALTENGESFYQHASLILEELRAAQDELLQRQGEQAGQINIGLGASVAPVADAVGDLSLSSAASAGKGADHGGPAAGDDQ